MRLTPGRRANILTGFFATLPLTDRGDPLRTDVRRPKPLDLAVNFF